MSRVCKRIFGFLGLALVVGVTAFAMGVPPVRDAAAESQDVTVTVTVMDGEFMANILSPANGEIKYSGETTTATISYTNAKTLTVYVTGPDGVRQEIENYQPADSGSGSFNVEIPTTAGYGEYKIELEGTDLSGNPMVGSTIMFSYKGASAVVPDDEDGTLVVEPGSLTVSYGKGVCSLGFQVYAEDDTDLTNPLLSEEYRVAVEPATDVVPLTKEVVIPGFADLAAGKYQVLVTSYGCGDESEVVQDETIVTLERAEGGSAIEPPKTGVMNVLGMTVSQVDYIVTGVIVFVLAALFAIFLMKRKNRSNR